MKFWNYIGEFFLFRWLLGKLSKSNKVKKDDCTSITIDPVGRDDDAYTTVPTEDPNRHNDLDSSEEIEELDDLDILGKYNNTDDVFRPSQVNYGTRYDYRSKGGYGRSFDDFHEEQDDYDMMDDF